MDELEEVDGAVEEGGVELALEIDFRAVFSLFEAVDVVGDVDEGDDVDGELTEDGRDDVPVPDVVLRSGAGELFDRLLDVSNWAIWLAWKPSYLCARNAQEAHAHEHSTDRHLSVPKLDAV